MSIVRNNLMTREGYAPYCGDVDCRVMPRTFFNGEQFECPLCKWRSSFEKDFIVEYENKWLKARA